MVRNLWGKIPGNLKYLILLLYFFFQTKIIAKVLSKRTSITNFSVIGYVINMHVFQYSYTFYIVYKYALIIHSNVYISHVYTMTWISVHCSIACDPMLLFLWLGNLCCTYFAYTYSPRQKQFLLVMKMFKFETFEFQKYELCWIYNRFAQLYDLMCCNYVLIDSIYIYIVRSILIYFFVWN